MFYFDKSYIILLPAIIIAAWAQMKVSSTFEKFSKVLSYRGYTGAEVARRLLDSNGLYHVPVELTEGKLSDHYDPSKRVMRLSHEVFYGNSIAAIGVAAHETGHAVQHKEQYAPLGIRNSIVPVVNFSSNASWIIIIAGMILRSKFMITIGILLFIAVVFFQIITLPVEFNASSRALSMLESKEILSKEEIFGAKKVLDAAALTYVAAAITAIAQLLRLVFLARSNDE